MAKEPMRVLVTGAAGQIGYALVPMIARGVMLGADQPVILHMLDIPPAAEALNGVKMELVDAAFPLLKGVVATTDVVEACTGVNVAVMVGGFPRKEGMERKDVMSKNVSIYKSQASALEAHAAPNCKVLVVANPANTNALILKEFAPSIPEKNVTCLTRLDHNRALGQISERLNVQVSDVKNVIIWGLMVNSSQLSNSVVLQSLKRESSPVLSRLLALLVTTFVIGFLEHLRVHLFPWVCTLMVHTVFLLDSFIHSQ
uniref:Malate dehydrogenase n=1 Tax=Zea mays TaxID=4577 RepID=A0A804LYM4_MAIZE